MSTLLSLFTFHNVNNNEISCTIKTFFTGLRNIIAEIYYFKQSRNNDHGPYHISV